MYKLKVTLYTVPVASCDPTKMGWDDVAKLLKSNLQKSFPDIAVGHVEFMSPEWFGDEWAQKRLESGEVNFPFVMVNGEIASADKKVNISKVKRKIEATLQEH